MKGILKFYGVSTQKLKHASKRDDGFLTILALAIPFASLIGAGIFGFAVLFFTGYRLLSWIIGIVAGCMVFFFEKSSFEVTTLSQAMQRIFLSILFCVMVIPMKVEFSKDDLIQKRIEDHQQMIVEMREDSTDALLDLLDEEKDVMKIQSDAAKSYDRGDGIQALADARRLVSNFKSNKPIKMEAIAQKYNTDNLPAIDTSNMTLLSDYVATTLANPDPTKKWFDIILLLFIFLLEALPGLCVIALLKGTYIKHVRHRKEMEERAKDKLHDVESKIIAEEGDPNINELDIEIANAKVRYSQTQNLADLKEISRLTAIKKTFELNGQNEFYQKLETLDEGGDNRSRRSSAGNKSSQINVGSESQNGVHNGISPFNYE